MLAKLRYEKLLFQVSIIFGMLNQINALPCLWVKMSHMDGPHLHHSLCSFWGHFNTSFTPWISSQFGLETCLTMTIIRHMTGWACESFKLPALIMQLAKQINLCVLQLYMCMHPSIKHPICLNGSKLHIDHIHKYTHTDEHKWKQAQTVLCL